MPKSTCPDMHWVEACLHTTVDLNLGAYLTPEICRNSFFQKLKPNTETETFPRVRRQS